MAADVTVGGAVTHPTAVSKPDVILVGHPAPQHTGRCHRHLLSIVAVGLSGEVVALRAQWRAHAIDALLLSREYRNDYC